MVIDRMDGFAALGRQLLDRFQGSSPADARREDPLKAEIAAAGEGRKAVGDKAEISPKAHRLIALRHAMDSGHKALEALPDVRSDRVAEARSRLNRGYYNSLEVRTRVAERLDEVARKLENI